MQSPDDSWFMEEWPNEKAGISFRIKEKLYSRQSEFQLIEVFETESFGKLMALDGLVMLTDRDNFIYHEMMTHPALFAHAEPHTVLVIGGGDCGSLREVLKHPGVRETHQIEIDEQVTRVSERFFPDLCSSNGDPRAHLHFEDGIKWIANSAPDTYDVIIIDSTDPVGPAAGLFHKKFYAGCYKALKNGGIVIQQSESPLFHTVLISDIHKVSRSVGFSDTQTLFFPQTSYPSGWWSCTLSGKNTALSDFRLDDAENKAIETRYYNAAIHRAAMAKPEFIVREFGF